MTDRNDKLAKDGPEAIAASIISNYTLRSLHIFARAEGWRVFGSRGTEAFQQSVEEGGGENIIAALRNLEDRLTAGPIRANEVAPLPRILRGVT